MSRADELLAQYERKISQVGQWVAVRRFSGTTTKTYVDTLTRAYVTYRPAREFVGPVMQNYLVAIVLVGTLESLIAAKDINTNDKLMIEFFGYNDAFTTPPLSSGHVSGGKERAITSAMKRAPEGRLIALEILAVG